jgi:hypothetical protein
MQQSSFDESLSTLELLETVEIRTYKNKHNIFSVEKVTLENRKDHSKFSVYTDHSTYACTPSEVPEKIVDRNSLIKIIEQMLP